ncbi:MAG: hypothetical protein EA351_13640 [Gemmatimonadales bacterium]|nr:MAG: hypothetical protein EA351_13640 [Gemmatimonadales bacterium]
MHIGHDMIWALQMGEFDQASDKPERVTNPCGWQAMHLIPHRTLVVLTLGLATGCAPQGEPSVCEISDPAGPTVHISVDEVADADRWDVVEIWRASGLAEDGAQMMLPTSARVGADGTLAIADFLSGDVWLLDQQGSWLDPVAGRGEGPGELLSPLATAWTPEGELLALDAAQSKLERFDLEAGTAETMRLPPELLGPVFSAGEVGWFGLRGDGATFVELPSLTSTAGTVEFASARPGDTGREVIWTSEYPSGTVPSYDRATRPEWPRAQLGVGGEGWAVAPASDRYEIIVFGPSDEPEIHICVTDRERFRQEGPDPFPPEDQWLAEIEALPRTDSEAIFSRVHLDHDGRIWVERELPRPGAAFDPIFGVAGAHLDVLSPSGEFLARVKLPEKFRFQDAKGDTIWAFAIGEFNEVDVVAAQIRSRAP